MVDARHVEIQVLADAHGNVIHLGERDCSVQRRHQKVLEEAPSPAVDAGAARAHGRGRRRRRQGHRLHATPARSSSCSAADGAFYFLEMNTRLQVEHPVTELVTGLDLVELQIRVAAGEPLPLAPGGRALHRPRHRGAALRRGAAPGLPAAVGPARRLAPAVRRRRPRRSRPRRRARPISPYYDPLLAKIIAHGATREEARRRLIQALEDTIALGIATNRGFLIDCLQPSRVRRAAQATTAVHPEALRQARRARRRRRRARPCRRRCGSRRAPGGTATIPRAPGRRAARSPGRCSSRPAASRPRAPSPFSAPRRYRVDGGDAPVRGADRCRRRRSACCAVQPRRARSGARAYAFAGDSLHLKLGALDLAVRETLYAPPASARAAGGIGDGAARAHERQGRGRAGGRGRGGRQGPAPRRRRGHEDAARDDGAGARAASRASPSSPATRWPPASCSSS